MTGVGFREIAVAVCALSLTELATSAPQDGWTLYGPIFGDSATYLVDGEGNVAHTWPSLYSPGASVYLADNGAIIRPANDPSIQTFGNPGVGGRIERISRDGTVEWSYVAAGPDYVQHHDIEILPNGNILAIVWERFTADEAIAMGRDPAKVGSEVWSEAILEIEPVGRTGGNIVWEWHVWDHLVQNFDPALPNYGDPADFPGRIDINFGPSGDDWLHINAIAYNPDLDQIVLSIRTTSEIWIVSHDPADSGELLFRWGNPQAYGRGGPEHQTLFGQHDPQWIPPGFPGEGNITLFNNGTGARGYSSIDELDTFVQEGGVYLLPPNRPFMAELAWTCDLIDNVSFFENTMSGVHRLSNGNNLVTRSNAGYIVEVDSECSSISTYDVGNSTFRATRIGEGDPRLEGLFWKRGDTNGDFVVNVVDLLNVLAEWGAEDSHGDVNGDGIVDILDLLEVLANWG